MSVGVIGLGYWGSNVARNLDATPGCSLAWGCDVDPMREKQWRENFPAARFTRDVDRVLAADGLDAVAVCTPVPCHAEMAERAIKAGKHCFVEKPLSQRLADAERVAALAEARHLTLMVGHLLEYHPGIEALKTLLVGGELGEVHYIYSQRLNLGRLRADENALWSLGAHDIAVVLALMGELPSEVSARGESYVREGIEDVVFAFLRFRSGVAAHMHLSWLDPHKERRLTVVGSKRMATFDDMVPDRKLTVYDKGFDPDEDLSGGYVTRSGEAHCPALLGGEPLRLECEHFLDCVRNGRRPRSDGASGVCVVRVLDGLQRSLKAGGANVELGVGEAIG